uniref:Methyltransferase domain-containing protein n=1 Tax=Leersia perrieri TaxID=77586 RepID=A0A0D9Y1B2_9ORYZ
MAAATPAIGSGGRGEYSCETADQTREWMDAIAAFLRLHRPLLEAHVVNFFKDRLWEILDAEWMECLRREPVERLLVLPSGCEHWPSSLRDFVLTARSLVLPREQKSPRPLLPDFLVASINTVLAQGMNSKKKHEIETLAAMVHGVTKRCGAKTVIDVGSGQGYLAQALSFEYQLPVVAIDASSHHASVTNTRAERIKKHYAAKCMGKQKLGVPRTVTCHVLSSDTLAAVTLEACQDDHAEHVPSDSSPRIEKPNHSIPPLVLAGLHACGDLSVNMLRVFVSCEQVKALISIGCCYNLLSEECHEDTKTCPGFPMSKAAKLSNLVLGKSIRDLGCQSAERWRSLTKEIALQNFDIHAFRAAFQMVLEKHFPEVSRSSPSIGRQGKALRRQRLRKVMEARMAMGKTDDLSCFTQKEQIMSKDGSEPTDPNGFKEVDINYLPELSTGFADSVVSGAALVPDDICLDNSQKFTLFKDFTVSALGRLGCDLVEDVSLLEIWKDVHPFTEFIGPFWCLRAALGPLVETYILLDRLLFLQEQGSVIEASLFPLFDPTMSPRNMAIIAWKLSTNSSKMAVRMTVPVLPMMDQHQGGHSEPSRLFPSPNPYPDLNTRRCHAKPQAVVV